MLHDALRSLAASPAPTPVAVFAKAAPPADVVTAWATVALALLAFASAFYARRLWLEATKQFAESKRSTDLDIALRMLARCDDPEILEAERNIGSLYRSGLLASRDALDAWLRSGVPSNVKSKAMTDIDNIFTLYEHVGIVLRKVPATSDILVDYLCLRAPDLFDALKVLIDEDKVRAAAAHTEFEHVADACRAFAIRTGVQARSN